MPNEQAKGNSSKTILPWMILGRNPEKNLTQKETHLQESVAASLFIVSLSLFLSEQVYPNIYTQSPLQLTCHQFSSLSLYICSLTHIHSDDTQQLL